jgi:GYF domain 2/Interferon-induced transmembrane protein
MIWFYSKNGQQLGPISEEEFSRKCMSGEILSTDLVWKEGMSDWKPLMQTTGLSLVQKTALPIDLAKPHESNLGNVMVVQPPPVDVQFIPQRIPNYQWQSIVALVLGGVQMMVICLPLGLIFGIIALVYANKVEPYFMQQNYLAAQDASRSAKIWMIVSLSMSGLVIIGIIVAFAVMIVSA